MSRRLSWSVALAAVTLSLAVPVAEATHHATQLDRIARDIPPGRYRVRAWAPPAAPDSVFVYVLTSEGAPDVRIYEPFFVTDLGVKTPEDVAADAAGRYAPALGPGDVVVERLAIGPGSAVAYVVHHRALAVQPKLGGHATTLYLRGPGTIQGGGTPGHASRSGVEIGGGAGGAGGGAGGM